MHEYFVWHRVVSLLYNQPEEFIKKERICEWRMSVDMKEQLLYSILNIINESRSSQGSQ